MANNIRFTARPFHFVEGPQFLSIRFQPGSYLGPFETLMAIHVLLETGLQCSEQLFTSFS